MRALVTGGAGYVGSVVVETFVAAGWDVVAYDDLSEGDADAVIGPATLVRGDLADVVTLGTLMGARRFDAVVHLAAHSNVADSIRDPSRYYRNNVAGTFALLEAMRQSETRLLVFSSSASVYGEPAAGAIDEATPLCASSPYGHGKAVVEQALPYYGAAHGLRWCSLRYFNVAGATDTSGECHEPETHLIPLALQTAWGQRADVTIYGRDYATRDGTCVRDYVHVADVAQAHLLAAQMLLGGGASGSYNLGCGGQGYTVQEVLQAVERVTGKRLETRDGPRRPGDPASLVAADDRVRRELRWRPRRPRLETMVEDAWRFFVRAQGRTPYARARGLVG